MNKANGFIVLHRKILDWGWYGDINTFRLFIHLLLIANHEDHDFHGKTIKRGQVVTSLSSLATSASLTIRQTRTALEHLKSTGEVTSEASNQNQVISIVNYDKYQDKRQAKRQATDTRSTSETTSDRHADRQQYNNINNETNKTIIRESEREKPQPKRFIKPTREECMAYAHERGDKIDGEYFFDYYEANGWEMLNWKAKMRTWEKREEKYKNGSAGKAGNSGNTKGSVGKAKTDYSVFSAGVLQL